MALVIKILIILLVPSLILMVIYTKQYKLEIRNGWLKILNHLFFQWRPNTWTRLYYYGGGLDNDQYGFYDPSYSNYLGEGSTVYNSFAIMDPRGLCPEGWHVPSWWISYNS